MRLQDLGGDFTDALERIKVPAYVIDTHGIIRWLNSAAMRIVGDVRGLQITSVVAPEERRHAREIFMRNLTGPPEGSENKGVVVDADGKRVAVELCAVPLTSDNHVIGVFGQVTSVEVGEQPIPHPSLTPRQLEVLHLLEHGQSTDQIARSLHLSVDTVRNHIRHLMRALGAHSRLEAVALARREHVAAG